MRYLFRRMHDVSLPGTCRLTTLRRMRIVGSQNRTEIELDPVLDKQVLRRIMQDMRRETPK
jgi:hypothetical protein